MKEAVNQDLPKAFESLFENMKKRKCRFYIIESPKSVAKLNYDDIYYLRVEGKYTYFHTTHEIYKDRRSMKQALEVLDSPVFMAVNKGYAVNLRHIMEIKNQQAIMRVLEKRMRQEGFPGGVLTSSRHTITWHMAEDVPQSWRQAWQEYDNTWTESIVTEVDIRW